MCFSMAVAFHYYISGCKKVKKSLHCLYYAIIYDNIQVKSELRYVHEHFFWISLSQYIHRSLKFGPYITYIASKPKAHGVIT